MFRAMLVVVGSLSIGVFVNTAEAQTQFDIEPFLVEGRLADAVIALTNHLEESPDDARAQFGMGIVELLQAVENLAQNLHRYGLKPTSPQLPFVRLPVPPNPNPVEMTYEDWRDLLQQFHDDLEKAAATLSKVRAPDVKLRVPVGMVRMDLDGNGEAGEDETFWRVFTRVAWRAAKLTDEQQRFPIAFDAADVHWMIGYTHLLRALVECWLAHDTEFFFSQTAHFFFAGASATYEPLGTNRRDAGFDTDQIADAIAAIHLVHFEPTEPARLHKARRHLLAMIRQSRLCWEHVLAEEDNDREWIPNARQTSLTPLTVTNVQIAAWKQFLDESEAVLRGKKLLPHWRVKDGRGINLKRVFEEPGTFDLVLWVHGSAAVPYLEEGELVSSETSRSLNAAFQGRFLAFAVWFQ